MNKILSSEFMTSMKNAQIKLSQLDPEQKASIEKTWDVEHAYYSSVLEGSDIDKNEFEKLAESVD